MMKVRQAGLQTALITGRYAPYSKTSPSEGVVIAVRYKDDERNISKQYTEYDVKDLRTGQVYPNCRRMHQTGGVDDGQDDTLRQANKILGTSSPTFDAKRAQLSQSDGDRVMLSFSYGAHTSPVIIGVIPHRATTYAATREQGERKLTAHKGTTIEIDKDGVYTVRHKSGSVIRMLDDGDVEIVPVGELRVGEATAAAPVGRVGDSVQVSIPPGTVLVSTPLGPAPNPVPIPLTGTITSGAPKVKG